MARGRGSRARPVSFFLLGSLKHFLAKEWDRACAPKRGGRFQIISLDAPVGENRLRQEPATATTPEREFDRRWALALLDTVLERLAREYAEQGKAALFQQLKGTLGGDRAEGSHAQLTRELAMSEGAVRVAAHRLRRRYRELLRLEIAQTVATDSSPTPWKPGSLGSHSKPTRPRTLRSDPHWIR